MNMHNTLVSTTAPISPAVTVPDLSSMALLTRWAVSMPTLRKKDKAATVKAEEAAGAVKGVASLTKALLGDCAEFKALADAASKSRNKNNDMTRPWFDNGHRIVATSAMMEHRRVMGEERTKLNDLFQEFLATYEFAVANQQARMGTLFIASEYPDRETLQSQFAVHLEYCSLPNNDFRTDLPREIAQEMVDDNERMEQERREISMRSLWDDLYKELTRFSRQLDTDGDGKGNRVFGSTLDRNLYLCDMLKSLNITGCSQMEQQRQRLMRVFSDVTIEGVRNSPNFRADKKAALDVAIAALPSLDF